MNLGQAVFRAIAGRQSKRDESPKAMVNRAIAEAGGVSQLARALGVARTTVQRWNRGSTPTQESTELLRAVLRRADLSEARANRMSTSNHLIVSGRQGDGKGGTRKRTIDVGKYLNPGTMGRAVEAYLRGASPHDLHVIVWAGIHDKNYRWLFQPPGGIAQQGPQAVQRAVTEAMGGPDLPGGGGSPSGPSRGFDDFDDETDEYYDGEDLMYEGDYYDIPENDGYGIN